MEKWRKVENRLAIYSCIFFCLYLWIFSYYTVVDISNKDKFSSPFGVDFAVYYATGQMVLEGNIEDIYDIQLHHTRLETILDRDVPFSLPWVYPPTFLLAVLPFSYFSYNIALIIWITSTFVLAISAVYLLVPNKKNLIFIVFGFPGVLMNLRWGQNSFLNTALLGFGVYFMESNPMVSGLMFGFMTYKPQLAFFILLFLLLSKKWNVIFWSILFSLINIVVTVLVFGYNVWINFINGFFHSSSLLLTSVWESTAAIQPTLYSALRLFGIKGNVLKISLIIIAILTSAYSIWLWNRADRISIRGAIIVIYIFLISPYYVQYDLMLLSIPLLLISYDLLEYGYQKFEILMLGILWLMPIVNWPIVLLTGVQICPFVLMIVLLMLIYRIEEFHHDKKCNIDINKLLKRRLYNEIKNINRASLL